MNDSSYHSLQIDRSEQDVVTVTFDLPGKSQNIFEATVLTELDRFLDKTQEDSSVKLLLFRSGKPAGFFAGADVREIFSLQSFEDAKGKSALGQELFQKLESLSIPTVAVIHGVCLGGGLEFALACKYRIAVDLPGTKLGLPETQLGILPAWGGTQRLPRKVGLLTALQMILQGKLHNAQVARKIGLVDLVVAAEDVDSAVSKATDFLLANPSGPLGLPPKRTWSSWFVNHTSWGRMYVFSKARQEVAKQLQHYPALAVAIDAVEAGFQKPKEAGYLVEQEGLADLIPSPTCKSLISIFFQRERAKSGVDWKEADDDSSHEKIGSLAVVGGGIMGGGIAQLAAKLGIDVVLKEINEEFATSAREKIEQSLDQLVSRKRLTASARDAQLGRITFCSDWDSLKDVELAIEAVPEKMSIKHSVFEDLSQTLSSTALLASNTSALSIDEMQEPIPSPERFGGMHFFNPVHQMPLVEVVRGAKTSLGTISQLVRITKQLGKIPIVTKDSPGFLVNRILMPYLDEGVRLACEGYDIEQIDKEMRAFGMPMGPLELLDQVGLDVGMHVADSMEEIFGKESPTKSILSVLVERGNLGRKSGEGFYRYENKKRAGVSDWKSGQSFPVADECEQEGPTISDKITPIQTRLILAMINESARCLDEGVVDASWMVDLAMVLGTGYPPFRGGPLRTADQFGIKNVVHSLNILVQKAGPRFTPANGLAQLSTSNQMFFGTHEVGFEI